MPEIKKLLSRYPILLPCEADLRSALDLITTSFRTGGRLLVAGNGGSAADAQHIVGELAKGEATTAAVVADTFHCCFDRDRIDLAE